MTLQEWKILKIQELSQFDEWWTQLCEKYPESHLLEMSFGDWQENFDMHLDSFTRCCSCGNILDSINNMCASCAKD